LDPADPYDAFGDVACYDSKLTWGTTSGYRDIARHNVVRRNAFAFNTAAIRVRDSFNHIESNTFSGTSWTDEDDGETVNAVVDVGVNAELLMRIGEPATGITVINNVTLTETTPAGQNFVRNWGANVLFANNVDRYYQCVPESRAPGNRCTPLASPQMEDGYVKEPGTEPLNRCEVTGIPPGCPSRNEMARFPGVPDTWLATLYGANILPDVCKARAKARWTYCADEAATITTKAVVDGYYDESRVWSYAGP
jgi:hypothetical protein